MENSIRQLLDKLPKIQESGVADWCDQLCAFYEKNDRHSYSEITEYILAGDGGIEYAQKIVEELSALLPSFEDEAVKRKIIKLIDHIQLEIVRYRYLSMLIAESFQNQFVAFSNENAVEIGKLQEVVQQQYLEMKEKKEEMEAGLTAVHKEVSEGSAKMAELQEHMSSVQKKADKTARKIKNAQNESVTILGIFASIVLTFTGIFSFSASVLENIGQVGKYRLGWTCLGLAFVLLHCVYILLVFIRNINEEDVDRGIKEYPTCMKVFTVAVVISAVGLLVCRQLGL